MDAIGLLTTAAIFSEKSNIELRIIVTPSIPASTTNGQSSDWYSISEIANILAIGIINVKNNDRNNTVYIDFSDISDANCNISFITQNSQKSFCVDTDGVSSSSYWTYLNFKLDSVRTLSVRATRGSSSKNGVSSKTVPCILIY